MVMARADTCALKIGVLDLNEEEKEKKKGDGDFLAQIKNANSQALPQKPKTMENVHG